MKYVYRNKDSRKDEHRNNTTGPQTRKAGTNLDAPKDVLIFNDWS